MIGCSRRGQAHVRVCKRLTRGPITGYTQDRSHHLNQSYGGYQNLGTKGDHTAQRGLKEAQRHTDW